jgi:tight adherence protein B
VAALAVPVFGGRFLLGFRQRRRVRRFDNQLGDVILMLANALKAGYSFPQALMTVANTGPMPIAGEFGRTSREMQLGLSVDDALRRIVERNASEDLDLLITAVQIHRVVGGNLTEILESIANTIRERVRIKGEIRTLTAQARASGWIISLLPIGLAAVLTVIAPDYFTPMFTQLAGQIMLGVGLLMMGLGILIIRKIVAIRV